MENYDSWAEALIAALLLSERAQKLSKPSDFAARDLRWSRSALGWQIRHVKYEMGPRELPALFGGVVRVAAVRRFEDPPRRNITIAECRSASASEARFNPIHAELAQRFTIGKRYNDYDDEDQRVLLDAVWVPEFRDPPASVRSYISKGGCHSSPGDPGTWWLNVSDGRRAITPPQVGQQIAMFA